MNEEKKNSQLKSKSQQHLILTAPGQPSSSVTERLRQHIPKGLSTQSIKDLKKKIRTSYEKSKDGKE